MDYLSILFSNKTKKTNKQTNQPTNQPTNKQKTEKKNCQTSSLEVTLAAGIG